MYTTVKKVFSSLCYFHTTEEARGFFNLSKAFCPMHQLQYYDGVHSIDAPTERHVNSPSAKKGGRPPTLAPIDQMLFTRLQLRSIPNNTACCGLFRISDGDGTRYFTTWVRLMEELLLDMCPVWSPRSLIA